jgi:two-component system, chemotaxis family, sensor kinase Cph1
MNPASNHCPLPKFVIWHVVADLLRRFFRPISTLFSNRRSSDGYSHHQLTPQKQILSSHSLSDDLSAVSELETQKADLIKELEILRSQNEQIQKERENARMFISAIDQSSESIFFTDIKGRILYVNQTFEKNSGYTRDELLGQTPRILKSGVHPPQFYKDMWATLLRGDVWRSHLTNKRKDGSLYHEDANIAPVRNEQGKITSFVSVKTDITDLLESQRYLEEMNAELSRSNTELEQFAYVASHDLQEPLRSVSSCMQLLEKRYLGKLDERADEFIRHAVEACQRMRNLIDGLLSLSRVQAASNKLVATDTREILDQVCANLAHSIKESSARIGHDPLPVVSANPQMLVHLFQNLISNALKFSGGLPPVVHVHAQREEDHWLFSVSDQGIGIEQNYFDRIFHLFQRLHTREEYSGTGLGLAICLKIVERHGGKIWVESTLGVGSTFFFTLPAVHESATTSPEPANVTSTTHTP